MILICILTCMSLFPENKIYYMDISGNIDLMEKPDQSSRKMMRLKERSIVELIEHEGTAGTGGHWIRVMCKEGSSGWCIENQLQKMFLYESNDGYKIYFPYDWHFDSYKTEQVNAKSEYGNNYFHLYNYDNTKFSGQGNILIVEACITKDAFISSEEWINKTIKDEFELHGSKASVLYKNSVYKTGDIELLKIVFSNINKGKMLNYYYRNGTRTAIFHILPADTEYIRIVEGIILNFEY
jgi:hypothetical protein